MKFRFLFFFYFLLLTGIWPDGADGTDINAVCRSHDGSLLASADDFGKVHLFSYPCSQPRVSVASQLRLIIHSFTNMSADPTLSLVKLRKYT